MEKGFIFDINKCVGCHACVLACQIENGKEQAVPWREINPFNAYQHPQLPVFYYSMACNHCKEASCMENCPALAYTKNENLNTIDHHADRCIGCKYCTWACPYDAPKYNSAKGVVEKCTLCLNRLQDNLKPACANLCPTGALDYQEIVETQQKGIKGFTELGIKPKIKIVELRKKSQPRSQAQLSKEEEQVFSKLQNKAPSKISLKKEWALIPFTLLVALLSAFFAAAVLGFQEINPILFVVVSSATLLLGSIHLGKKSRAWRSILNIRNSWLSREILFYGMFMALSVLWLFFRPNIYVGIVTSLAGFACAYAVDKVYKVSRKTTQIDIHSASVFLTTLLLFSLFTMNEQFLVIILVIKTLFYVYRKIYFFIHKKPIRYFLSIVRILVGFVLPFIIWNQMELSLGQIFILALIVGEVVDRIEFYLELDIITPAKQINEDLATMHESIVN